MRHFHMEKRNINIIVGLFVAIQVILYVTFLFLDLEGADYTLSAQIKFSIIILCFCLVFFFGKHEDKGIILCMKTAVLFTLISDLFLLMLDRYLYGMITFVIVQQLYSIRLTLTGHRSIGRHIIKISFQLILTMVIMITLFLLGLKSDILLIISVFYFISIITNTVLAIICVVRATTTRSNRLFAVGMVLFLLCDINVGIFNMSGFIAIPENIYRLLYSASSILMWTFYAPSQVILALSSTLYTGQNQQRFRKNSCKNM